MGEFSRSSKKKKKLYFVCFLNFVIFYINSESSSFTRLHLYAYKNSLLKKYINRWQKISVAVSSDKIRVFFFFLYNSTSLAAAQHVNFFLIHYTVIELRILLIMKRKKI